MDRSLLRAGAGSNKSCRNAGNVEFDIVGQIVDENDPELEYIIQRDQRRTRGTEPTRNQARTFPTRPIFL
jgi:hypothetical protein